MKIQGSVLEFSTFLIFSTFHAVRAIDLKNPSKNLSDASSHFGNTFTNDSLGKVIIPVYYHTETSLPPTSKSTRTVTKTTLTTEKLTSTNPTSSHIGQKFEISHGPINTNNNFNNSDKNNSSVGSVTDNFSNLNTRITSSNRKTTVKQKTNPPSYSKTFLQTTTALPETKKVTIYNNDKKTEQSGEQTTRLKTLEPKSTTLENTKPTPTTSQTTTPRTTQVALQSTTALKTTSLFTSTPPTTKTPTTLPAKETPPTQTLTNTSTTTPAPTTSQTTTTPAPTTSQTTTTPAPTTSQTTTTPAPTTSQSTKTTTTSSITKLHTTVLQTAASTTTKATNQGSTTNIGSNDSAKKHNESLVSTTTTHIIPSMSQTNFVKISSNSVTENKDGGDTDSAAVTSPSSKSFTNNKEFTSRRHSINIASTSDINQNAFPTNSTEAERLSTTAETISEEPSQSDGDKYWPVAMAITIGVPSIIVIGVTISVINRKRLALYKRKKRFRSSPGMVP